MIKSLLKKIILPPQAKEDILNLLPQNSVCAEIGVWKGDFSELIIKKVKPKKLYLIDPFKYLPEYKDRWFGGQIAKRQKDMDKIYQGVIKKFSQEKSVEIIRDFSENASKKIKDNSLDFLYIDGNHSYSFVKKDLENYFPKVKEGGGIIAGDDLTWGVNEGLPVLRALINFLLIRKNNIKIVSFKGGQFVLRKK